MGKSKREYNEPFVAFYHSMIDSAAFKSLSPEGVWLLLHIRRQYHSKHGSFRLILPQGHIRFKLHPAAFRRARAELVELGFITIREQASGHDRKPNIYALSQEWERVSRDLLGDPAAGRVVRLWQAGELASVWVPTKKRKWNDNISRFNRNPLGRVRGRSSRRPTKLAVIQAVKSKGKASRPGISNR